jgi:hypothetical protein
MEIKAMKTTQAWGWLTAGVLALGLNGFYHDGGAAWAHRIADQVAEQSEAVVDLASERVNGFIGRASLVAAREEPASCRLANAVARFQAKIARTQIARTQTGVARFEAMSARQEAALARVEAQRARIEAQVARVRLAPVAFNTGEIPVVSCPRVRVNVPRVTIPRMPTLRIQAPVVRVDLSDGPI